MRLTLIVGIIALASSIHAQTPADTKPPVIQAESREVEVDVGVTGKKGISTDELTADYFSVREDGEVQKIDSIQSSHPETSLKHIVLYLDSYTSEILTDDRYALEKAAKGFIDSVAGPNRYISVMNMTAAAGARVFQDFTTSSAPLIQAISDSFTPWPAHFIGQRHSLGDSMAEVCRSMARTPGDKTMIAIGSYNFFQSTSVDPPTARAIQACNEANVRVYSVVVPIIRHRSGGWIMGGPPIAPRVSKSDGPAHSGLAEQTGGLAFGITPDLKDELTAVVREQDHYYRLFYTPPASKDGVCHKLLVSMNKREFSARARNGYCTEKRPEAVSIESEVGGVGSTFNIATQLPYFYVDASRASVHLAADFKPSGMRFEHSGRGLRGMIDIVGTAVLPTGETVARFADSIDVDQASQESADAFVNTLYHYEQQFYLPPGNYLFRLDIGVGPNAAGEVEVPLKVDPVKPDRLAMGSLALSTVTRPLPELPEVPILEGQALLVVDGQQFVPASRNVLQKSNHAYFYTQVYDPALSGANPESVDPSMLKMEYCIFDRTTGKPAGCSLVVSLEKFVHLGNPWVPFGTHLALEHLPAGPYRLEVRAAIPANQETVTRSIDFELK